MDVPDANYLKKIRERVNSEWDKVDGFHISDVAFLLRLLDEALARKHRFTNAIKARIIKTVKRGR